MKYLLILLVLNWNKLKDKNLNDFENLLGYRPKKILLLPNSGQGHDSVVATIIANGFEYSPGIYAKIEGDHYLVFMKKKDDYLFKLYGDVEYLKFLKDDELVPRKIQYYYLKDGRSSKRVVTISGYENIDKILFTYRADEDQYLQPNDKRLVKLLNGNYLYRDKNFINSCKIYPDLTTYEREANFKTDNALDVAKDYNNFNENIGKLEQLLNIKFSPGILTKVDLDLLIEGAYAYVSSGDLNALNNEMKSFFIKYLQDNHIGHLIVSKKEHSVTPILELNGEKYDINRTIAVTIETMTNFEFALNRYFELLQLDQ